MREGGRVPGDGWVIGRNQGDSEDRSAVRPPQGYGHRYRDGPRTRDAGTRALDRRMSRGRWNKRMANGDRSKRHLEMLPRL